MTWNNRIIKSKKHTEFGGKEVTSFKNHYSIREVYYDKKGNIEGWTGDFLNPIGESLEELKVYYDQWAEAFKAPVLEQIGNKLVETKEYYKPKKKLT